MKYRRLGQTGLEVSVFGIGTYQYGGEWGKDFTPNEVRLILDRGSDLGCNLIDTAECYGDHVSEDLIGQAISGSRNKWIIATKFGHRFCPGFKREQLWDSKSVARQLDLSLKSLQTDHIDLYLFHSGTTENLLNDELWTLLDKQVSAGKIGNLGISIGKSIPDPLRQVELASDLGVKVIEVLYNRLDRFPENDIFASCIRQDLGVIGRVPLASGLLSGKYHPGVQFNINDVRSTQDQATIDANLRRVDEIRETEIPAGVNMAQWAVAWCLRHPAVQTCITGFKDKQQLEDIIAGVDLVSDAHPSAMR